MFFPQGCRGYWPVGLAAVVIPVSARPCRYPAHGDNIFEAKPSGLKLCAEVPFAGRTGSPRMSIDGFGLRFLSASSRRCSIARCPTSVRTRHNVKLGVCVECLDLGTSFASFCSLPPARSSWISFGRSFSFDILPFLATASVAIVSRWKPVDSEPDAPTSALTHRLNISSAAYGSHLRSLSHRPRWNGQLAIRVAIVLFVGKFHLSSP